MGRCPFYARYEYAFYVHIFIWRSSYGDNERLTIATQYVLLKS